MCYDRGVKVYLFLSDMVSLNGGAPEPKIAELTGHNYIRIRFVVHLARPWGFFISDKASLSFSK